MCLPSFIPTPALTVHDQGASGFIHLHPWTAEIPASGQSGGCSAKQSNKIAPPHRQPS
jgi:hypothetical protein